MCIEMDDPSYFHYTWELTQIENIVEKKTISKKTREKLFQQLDIIEQKISDAEEKALKTDRFARQLFQKLHDQAISLYGKIDSGFYHGQMESIRKKALHLENALSLQDTRSIKIMKKALEQRIKFLLTTYAPPLSERRWLVIAKETIFKAEAFLQHDEEPLTSEEDLTTIEEIITILGENDDFNRQRLRSEWKNLNSHQKRLLLDYLNPDDVKDFLYIVDSNEEEIFWAWG